MKALRVVALGLAVSSLLCACPPKPVPDAGTPEVDAGTNEQLCHDSWQVLCSAWSTCSLSSQVFASYFSSFDQCVAKGTESCTLYSDGAVAAGGLGATLLEEHQQIASCTAVLAAAPACEVVITYVFGNNVRVDPECAALPGTFPSGAPCLMNPQCQSGYCRTEGGCGTCADLKDPSGSCATSMDCKPGLGCNNGLCTPWLSLDAGCNASALCGPGLACLTGHCSPALPAGATCNPNSRNTCLRGYCNRGKCEDFLEGAPNGGPCGVDVATGHVTACEFGSTCLFVTQAGQGVCVARAGPGERCFFDTSFQGSQCTDFSRCMNGVCSGLGPEPTCGQDGGATPARRDGGVLPPVDGGALASVGAAQTTLLCDAMYGCPRYQPLNDSWFGSQAACEAAFAPIDSLNSTDPFGRVGVADLTACNTALSAMPLCDRADALVAGAPLPAACAPPSGARPPGAPCMNGAECSASDRCNGNLLSPACGVCTTLQPDGGLCVSADDCLAGLGCANGHCVPAVGLSSACSAASPCVKGLQCILGACVPPGDVDAGCNPRNNECAAPLFCNSVSSQCELLHLVDPTTTPGPDGGALGAPCGVRDGGMYECPLGYACKLTNLTTTTGECAVTVGEGEVCPWTGGLFGRGPCRFPSNCTNGVCTIGDKTYCQ